MKKIITYTLGLFLVSGCFSVKEQSLWDAPADKIEPQHIENVYALSILEEGLNGDVWFTENISCINIKNSESIKCSGKKAIHLKWDKKEGGCDWIGMGIGWDNWSGKDLSQIQEKAAIQFKAYSNDGKLKSLPLAAALEDFGGQQAWLGLSGNRIAYKGEDSWATVTLPLEDFSWLEFGADISNIKQMIIQFEASGNVYFDDFKIVPYKGKPRKVYQTFYQDQIELTVDGKTTEEIWSKASNINLENSTIKMLFSKNSMLLGGNVSDATPAQNSKEGDDIWNGDALEIAFSTNSEANKKRNRYLYSDQQIGIRFSDNPVVWDWRKHKEIKEAKVQIQKTAKGFSFEVQIPNSYFSIKNWKINSPYGLEVALDRGTTSGRQKQIRWNSYEDGFYKNPDLWGELILIK